MHFNLPLLERIRQSGAKLVAVTKYWDDETKQQIVDFLREEYGDIFWGRGENRAEGVMKIEKREPENEKEAGNGKSESGLSGFPILTPSLHFIGHLQSRQIPKLATVDMVHSLCSEKHARLLDQLAAERGRSMGVFVQVKISEDSEKFGLSEEALASFVELVSGFDHLEIQGLSAMGAGDFTESEKRAEMRRLVALRDQYFPGKLISAGTSRDYEIALEEGIEVVRVGQRLVLSRPEE